MMWSTCFSSPYLYSLRNILTNRLDELHSQIKALQGSVAPVTDSVVSTIADATADFRASVVADIESLKAKLEPERAKLKDVVDRHVEEYRTLMEPILREYYAKHTAEMESLRAKLEPLLESLQTKMATNVEETKSILMPMVETVRAKLGERLENLKALVSPHVEEYKEQLKQVYNQAQNVRMDDVAAMRAEIDPMVEDVRGKLQAIFERIAATFNKPQQ